MARLEIESGIRLYVEEWGEGRPIVFVHGGGVTHAFWEHQVAMLMARFHTVTYDLRGCGESDRPPVGYSVDIWASDLAVLIESLQLERPVLVGHALGSHIVLRLAALRPDLIGKLVLASGAPWFVGDREEAGGFAQDFWENLQASWFVNRPQSELDLADEKYFYRHPGEGMRMACLRMALSWPLPVYMQLASTLTAVDHRDSLPHIKVPVLLLHGEHDRKNRFEGVSYLAKHIPDARVVTFGESAHCPPLEEPRAFTRALEEFLLESLEKDDLAATVG